mmetsp:Transcript_14933/g.16378  ORF Transcript_14933/g.16378 Transcript_14933/m.16378 type:complete len:160 (+) Transcript_14933:882-1361(+)
MRGREKHRPELVRSAACKRRFPILEEDSGARDPIPDVDLVPLIWSSGKRYTDKKRKSNGPRKKKIKKERDDVMTAVNSGNHQYTPQDSGPKLTLRAWLVWESERRANRIPTTTAPTTLRKRTQRMHQRISDHLDLNVVVTSCDMMLSCYFAESQQWNET